MRWFKHMTDLQRDEGVSRYLDAAGSDRVTAYGFLMCLLEAIASRMNATEGHLVCTATYSIPQWGRITYSHPNRVRKYLSLCEVIGWVHVEFEEGSCKVSVPRMVEWRDEYTRKSGHTPDKVAQRRGDKNTPEENREDAQKRTATPRVKDSIISPPLVPDGHALSRTTFGGLVGKKKHLDPRSFDELKLSVKPHIEKFGANPDLIHRVAGQSLRMSKKQIATCVEQLVADCEVTLPVAPLGIQ